uniref:MADF domain-containing protein n=1 Tax=Steinernema glaseri TaxID=37863 RepID=A0A1I7ZSE9_9BILA
MSETSYSPGRKTVKLVFGVAVSVEREEMEIEREEAEHRLGQRWDEIEEELELQDYNRRIARIPWISHDLYCSAMDAWTTAITLSTIY